MARPNPADLKAKTGLPPKDSAPLSERLNSVAPQISAMTTDKPKAAAPPAEPAKSKGGRPRKAGDDAFKMTLLISQSLLDAIEEHRDVHKVPGRAKPNAHDLIRWLVAGAAKHPDTMNRLIAEGRR